MASSNAVWSWNQTKLAWAAPAAIPTTIMAITVMRTVFINFHTSVKEIEPK